MTYSSYADPVDSGGSTTTENERYEGRYEWLPRQQVYLRSLQTTFGISIMAMAPTRTRHFREALPTFFLGFLMLASASASRVEVDPQYGEGHSSAKADIVTGGAVSAGEEAAPLTRGSADSAQRNRRLLQLGKPKSRSRSHAK